MLSTQIMQAAGTSVQSTFLFVVIWDIRMRISLAVLRMTELAFELLFSVMLSETASL